MIKELRVLWDNIMHTKIHNLWAPEGEEREKGIENVFDGIMAETSQTQIRNQISRYRKNRGSQTR